MRQGLKTYSNWPTYPQLYVKGELVGGLDIVKVGVGESCLRCKWTVCLKPQKCFLPVTHRNSCVVALACETEWVGCFYWDLYELQVQLKGALNLEHSHMPRFSSEMYFLDSSQFLLLYSPFLPSGCIFTGFSFWFYYWHCFAQIRWARRFFP